MTGPDHIWATVNGASTDVITHKRGLLGGWREHLPQWPGHTEYIRREPAVLAALPEVQALVTAEREAALAGVLSVVRAEFAKWIGQMDPKAGERSRVEWNLATGLRDRVIEAMTRILASIQPETEAVEMAEAAAFSAGFEAGERAEREACAKLAESFNGHPIAAGIMDAIAGQIVRPHHYCQAVAAAIRKRGEGKG